jgi:hypothetical protein
MDTPNFAIRAKIKAPCRLWCGFTGKLLQIILLCFFLLVGILFVFILKACVLQLSAFGTVNSSVQIITAIVNQLVEEIQNLRLVCQILLQ